jgi:plasmid replication initiation protein
MVVEGEFAGPLRVMTREGNTLSVLIRQGWDGVKLATLTKNSPLKATDAQNSVIGHITKTEVLRLLSETDAHNDFANRYLWLLVRRSKALPSAITGIPTTRPCWSSGSKTP